MNKLDWELTYSEDAEFGKLDVYDADFVLSDRALVFMKLSFSILHYSDRGIARLGFCSWANSPEEDWSEINEEYSTADEAKAAAEKILDEMLEAVRKALKTLDRLVDRLTPL